MSLNINDDAIFIADSHYNLNRQNFKEFLLKIISQKISTSQLFLMGDIFDFLAPQIQYFVKQNQEIIDILNNLSNKIDIIYLEGNHDFNLKLLFPNIVVVPREQQPLFAIYKTKKVALAHGDIFTPFGYNFYTAIIRHRVILNILNLIDIKYWLSLKINNWLMSKNICDKQVYDKDKFISRRKKLYDCDLIIEGHFHYDIQRDNYINLPSFACAKQYFQIKNL